MQYDTSYMLYWDEKRDCDLLLRYGSAFQT